MRKKSVPQKLADKMQIPKDLAYQEPVLTMIGQRELCVENYKCIRYYTDSCIVLLTKNGRLKLEGDRLSIQSYDNEEIRVTGVICRLEFIG